MGKQERQQALLDLIHEYDIDTQEELTERLSALGYKTTQATISRDIRELKLEKISINGKHKYVVGSVVEPVGSASYKHLLSTGIVSMDYAQNIIVVKTVAGMAMAVGAAIDNLEVEGIMGCIAGDDTLFLAIKSNELAEKIIGDIKKCC